MESFRLKNIIILILALMNLCLLGLLGVRLTTGYSAQAEARQQMVQLFARRVSLWIRHYPRRHTAAGLTLSRDPDEDEKLAGFLLGDELVMSDGGGGVTTYQSENGSAVFRSDGTFDVVIEQSGETADALCGPSAVRSTTKPSPSPWMGRTAAPPRSRPTTGPRWSTAPSPSPSPAGGWPPSAVPTCPRRDRPPMGTVPLSALDALNAFLGTVQSGAGGHCRDGPVPLL